MGRDVSIAEVDIEEQHLSSDRQGDSYRVEVSREGASFDFVIHGRGTRIADAWCIVSLGTVNLNDVVVRDEVPVRDHWALKFWRQGVLRLPAPRMNYRARGLGTELLRLIQRATHFGFHEIGSNRRVMTDFYKY